MVMGLYLVKSAHNLRARLKVGVSKVFANEMIKVSVALATMEGSFPLTCTLQFC